MQRQLLPGYFMAADVSSRSTVIECAGKVYLNSGRMPLIDVVFGVTWSGFSNVFSSAKLPAKTVAWAVG